MPGAALVSVAHLADRRATLRTVDWVKDASIARLWPNRVVVRVWERVPVALSFRIAPSSRFGLIDEDGVILPSCAGSFATVCPVLAVAAQAIRAAQRRDPRSSHASPDA